MKITASLTKEKVASLKAEDKKFNFLPDEGVEVEIEYPLGETLEEMLEVIPEEVIRTKAIGHIKFTIQGMIREALSKGLSEEEIQALFYTEEAGFVYIPSAGRQRKAKKSSLDSLAEDLVGLDDDARAEELAKLEAKIAELMSKASK